MRSLILLLLIGSYGGFAKNCDKDDPLCKKLAIDAAQLANTAYAHIKQVYFDENPQHHTQHIDTAIAYMEQSVAAIDSALLVSSDSDSIAREHAIDARDLAVRSYQSYLKINQTPDAALKKELLKEATFYSANTCVEYYHTSLYFTKDKKPQPEPAKETPTDEKPFEYSLLTIAKVDIDQTLFAILDMELSEKLLGVKKDLKNLNSQLANTTDPSKRNQLKEDIRNLEQKERDLTKKSLDTKEKLNAINKLVAEKNKNKKGGSEKDTIFSKNIRLSKNRINKNMDINPDLPMGLIYQVQIGLYKKEIPAAVFKGLTPIYGQQAEKGVSYSSGMFEKLEDAQEAKSYLREMGFSDAFIIAYYDQRKITVGDAIKLEKK